jgi:hypothetical protein
MSDVEEVESQTYNILPKDVTEEVGSVKLFNKARPPGIVRTHNIILTFRSGPTRRSKSATSL